MKKNGIICLGNPLRKDDGIGNLIYQNLIKKKCISLKVEEIIDGGTGGFDLLHDFSKFDTLIIIDAVRFNGKYGEVKTFKIKDLCTKEDCFSTHSFDLDKISNLSKELYARPKKIFIIGINPKDISLGNSLSSELENRFDDILKKIVQIIKETL